MTFRSCRKNGLIRKTMLISKFLTSQPGQQAIAIHILPNISRSKGNQTMKLGPLIEYNNRNIFLQRICRKWGRETSSRPEKRIFQRDEYILTRKVFCVTTRNVYIIKYLLYYVISELVSILNYQLTCIIFIRWVLCRQDDCSNSNFFFLLFFV